MIHIKATFEDLTITADIHSAKEATIELRDLKGKHETRDITCDQLAAIFALAIGSDEIGEGRGDANTLRQALYEMADEAVKDLPATLRPIP